MIRPLPLDGLISFYNPMILWNEHWFAVVFEIVSAALLYQIFRHAKRHGNVESSYLILAAMFSTLFFELLPFVRPGYELWWYHLGIVNMWKQRVPSYVISFYAISHYLAYNLTKKSNLPNLTRSLVSAVVGILVVFPFLWMASRLLLLTYHFDDPVFRDRLFDVPYMQIFILFLLFFHTSHLYQENYAALQPQERNSYNYFCCALQSGIVAAIYTIVEQYVIYLFITLTMKFNVGFCILTGLAIMAYLAKGEIKELQLTSISTSGILQPLKRKEFWAVAAGFILLTTMPLWLNFESLKSTNERLELGPCKITHLIGNTSPLEVTRRRFLCPEDVKKLSYDFHCMEKNELLSGIQKNDKHYTICGKTMANYVQTVEIMAIYSLVCLFIFHSLMRLSFNFKIDQKTAVMPKKEI